MRRHASKLLVSLLEDRTTPAVLGADFCGPVQMPPQLLEEVMNYKPYHGPVVPPDHVWIITNPVEPPDRLPDLRPVIGDPIILPPHVPLTNPIGNPIILPPHVPLTDPIGDPAILPPIIPLSTDTPQSVSVGRGGLIKSISTTQIVIRQTPDSTVTFAIDPTVIVTRNGNEVSLAEVLKVGVGEFAFLTVNPQGVLTHLSVHTPTVLNPGLESSMVTGMIEEIDAVHILVRSQATSITTLYIAPGVVVTRNGVATNLADVALLAWFEQVRATVDAKGIVTHVEITSGINYQNPGTPAGQYNGTIEAISDSSVRVRISPTQTFDLKVGPITYVTLNSLETSLASVPASVVGADARVTIRYRGHVESLEISKPIDDATTVDPDPQTGVYGTIVGYDLANKILYVRGDDFSGKPTPIYRVRATANTTFVVAAPPSSYQFGLLTTASLTFDEFAARRDVHSRVWIVLDSDGLATHVYDPIIICS